MPSPTASTRCYSTAMHYPGGVNLLANTSVVAIGLLLAPVTWLFGPIATLNVALTLAPALSALSMYVLLRRWVAWAPAAFVGGLLYGFSPFILVTLTDAHLMLGMAVVPPLVVACLDELLFRQRRQAGTDRGRPRPPADRAVLHRHRGPGDHGTDGSGRGRPDRRLLGLAAPIRAPGPRGVCSRPACRPARPWPCCYWSFPRGTPSRARPTSGARCGRALYRPHRPQATDGTELLLVPLVAVEQCRGHGARSHRRRLSGAGPVVPVLRDLDGRRRSGWHRGVVAGPPALAVRRHRRRLCRAVPGEPGGRLAALEVLAEPAHPRERRALPLRPDHLPCRRRHAGVDRRARLRGRQSMARLAGATEAAGPTGPSRRAARHPSLGRCSGGNGGGGDRPGPAGDLSGPVDPGDGRARATSLRGSRRWHPRSPTIRSCSSFPPPSPRSTIR